MRRAARGRSRGGAAHASSGATLPSIRKLASASLSKFRAAILDVAGDLDDLKHITEPDFEELVRGMPKLKARRLRASLVELGARLA